MADAFSPAMAFQPEESHPPQATISLSQTSLMTPEPTSPGSYYSIKEESLDGDESKKTTKKRKSWGQELPTPKTNLPPRYTTTLVNPISIKADIIFRKRAKTEDEKEQRRIERVLRNRQAAQSSRERKRQEVEKLEGEKMTIEQQNESLKERLMTVEHEKFLLAQKVAKMSAQMRAIQSGTSNPHELSPPPESDLHQNFYIKQEIDDYAFTLPTPQHSFGAPSTSFPSPTTATFSESSTPATMSLGLDALTATPDLTQHPAAMLCDLQCQSTGSCQASTPPTTRPQAATPPSTANIYPILISAIYSQLMHPLMMIFISLKTGSPLPPSMTSTPMVLPLIRWLISTPTNLLPPTSPIRRATTPPKAKRTSPTSTRSARPTTPSQAPILRLRLLRRLLLSSPSLARPLEAATGRALRLKTGGMTGKNGALGERGRRVARRNGKAGLRVGVRSISRAGRDGERKRMYQYADRR